HPSCDELVDEEEDQCADYGEEEAPGGEAGKSLADDGAAQLAAQDPAPDTEQEGDDDAAGLLSGHDDPGDQTGEQADDDPDEDSHDSSLKRQGGLPAENPSRIR